MVRIHKRGALSPALACQGVSIVQCERDKPLRVPIQCIALLSLSATCNDKFPRRSPIAITGPMALELLGARGLDLVAHPFAIVHMCGVASG